MNNERSTSAQADPASPEPSAARAGICACGGGREPDTTDEDIRALRRLRDLSMAVAELIVTEVQDEVALRRAKPEPEQRAASNVTKHASISLDRVSRTVRLCIVLATRLQNDRLEREKAIAAAAAEEETERKQRRKDKLKSLVGTAIWHHVQNKKAQETEGPESEAETDEDDWDDEAEEPDEPDEEALLKAALRMRLEEEDIERDLFRCSTGELFARLADFVGIKPNWPVWSKTFWAQEEARLKIPGSPYAAAAYDTQPAPEAGESLEAAERPGSVPVDAADEAPPAPEANAKPAEAAEPDGDEKPDKGPEPPEWLMELRRRIGTAPPLPKPPVKPPSG
jgi:hypothetical protein